MALPTITTADIESYYDDLLREAMTRANLAHYHRIIRASLNRAKRSKLVVENPANDAELDAAPRPEMNAPTIDQARALMTRGAETESVDFGPLLLFAMLTGMRRGEIAGLQWPVTFSEPH